MKIQSTKIDTLEHNEELEGLHALETEHEEVR